jgi:CDP-diacylglycerol--glycerol-3-phosphate 3-phosphatidyltransferase
VAAMSALLDETPNGDAIAAGVFALAAFTDTLDGYIARQRNAVTTFGKLMDPIADKLLIAAALIYLAICLPLIYLANGLERRLNRRTA